MYFKILNKDENHHGLQYQTGTVEDILPWNPNADCQPGGIYFSDGSDICKYLSYGPYIRQVKVPKDTKVSHGKGKSKASKVWLGKRRELRLASTWKWMIQNGVDIHADGDYALGLAARSGHVEVVQTLLEAGANVHAGDDLALKRAAANGHVEVVRTLLEAGANVHAEDDYALELAAAYGHVEVVRTLLEAGANVHAENDYALGWAAEYGHVEVVRVLLEAGANVHAEDDYALRWAAEYGRVEVVKLLENHPSK